MRKSVILVCLIVLVKAGMAQNSVAIDLANRIATRMKDTLSLTVPQRNLVYDINILLHNRKTAIRQLYTNTDSVSFYLQRAENKRDSLYHTIMSDSKYQLYLQKKRNLVNNN
jgi:hypothetical protein